MSASVGSSSHSENQIFSAYDYEKHWAGLPIAWFIRGGEDYVVFLDSENDLDWQTTKELDKLIDEKCGSLANQVFNFGAELNAVPVEHLTQVQRKNFRVMVGEGFARLFRLDAQNALQMLEKAQKYVLSRNEEVARKWQLQATGITAALFTIAFLVIWTLRKDAIAFLGQTGSNLVLGVCLGAVGALFSILVRMGDSHLDPSAGPSLHWMEGAARVLAGAVGAGVCQLAVHLSLILGVLKDGGLPAMLFVGLIAGASERLVPALIKRVENDTMAKSST